MSLGDLSSLTKSRLPDTLVYYGKKKILRSIVGLMQSLHKREIVGSNPTVGIMKVEISDEVWQMVFDTPCEHTQDPCGRCVTARKVEYLKSRISVTHLTERK